MDLDAFSLLEDAIRSGLKVRVLTVGSPDEAFGHACFY